jgi:hypothetical protein
MSLKKSVQLHLATKPAMHGDAMKGLVFERVQQFASEMETLIS